MEKKIKIGCVIVTYNPCIRLLEDSISSLLAQVDKIVIIDNSRCYSEYFDNEKCLYHSMNGNKGIGEAQNEGVKILEGCCADYILFMDQDSVGPSNLIEKLLDCIKKLEENSVIIGGVGPRPINRKEGKAYKGRIKKGKVINNELTEVSEIISSGSLIPIQNFSVIGNMDSNLFIDGVDHEWCWRAAYKCNMRFFINETVNLSHQLGEGDRYFLGCKIAISSPFRLYYQYRNFFWLLRRNYVPLYWKISNTVKYTVKLFYYPLFVCPRILYMKNIYRGIIAGFFHKEKALMFNSDITFHNK